MNFGQLLQFVDQKISPNGSSLVQMFEGTSTQAQMLGLRNFAAVNERAWISDSQMDLRKCLNTVLTVDHVTLDISKVFDYLSKVDQAHFWVMFCILIGRESGNLAREREAKLRNALLSFCQDLTLIGISMSPEDSLNFVSKNKIAIQNRLLGQLEPQINIAECDTEAFWAHVERIFNLQNPYDQIIYEPCAGKEFVSKIFSSVVDTVKSGDQLDFGSMLAKLTCPESMKQIENLFKDPSQMGDVINAVASLFPKN